MRHQYITISLVVLMLLMLTNAAFANTMTLPTLTVPAGQTDATFGLNLNNTERAASLQIHVTYDSTLGGGDSVPRFEITDIGLASRTSGYEPVAWRVDDTDPSNVQVIVLLYSYGLTTDSGDGDVLTFTCNTAENESGSSTLSFGTVLLSSQNAQALTSTGQDGNVEVTAPSNSYLLWTR